MTTLQTLWENALSVQKKSYSPYSHFPVGCSIQTNQGHCFHGCNIENASYGLTLCAEACAISQMVSAGETTIQDIMIVGPGVKLCPPCGACRQRLHEFSTAKTRVHLATAQGIQQSLLLTELLPLAFNLSASRSNCHTP